MKVNKQEYRKWQKSNNVNTLVIIGNDQRELEAMNRRAEGLSGLANHRW